MKTNPLLDTRKQWPGKEGTTNGQRFYGAIAERFAAGESLRALSDDYGIPEADIVLAVRAHLSDCVSVLDHMARHPRSRLQPDATTNVSQLTDILENAIDELSTIDQYGPVTIQSGSQFAIVVKRDTLPARVVVYIDP